MTKNKLEQFNIILDGEASGTAALPCSAAALISSVPTPHKVALSTSVELSDSDLKAKHAFLRLEGLTSPLTLYVNGCSVGEHDGVRTTFTASVAPHLVSGTNTFEIEFLSCEAENAVDSLELIRTDGAIIDRVSVTEAHEDGKVTLAIKTSLLGSAENLRSVATLVSGAGQIYYCGLTGGRGSITVKDPLYWWPRGLGIQNLYKLTVNMYGETEIEDTYEMRVGLTEISTANSTDGTLLEANGALFTPMGAVYKHSVTEPISKRRMCEAVITSSARAGFNSLVIPLGTPILPEYFYDMCDAHGIIAIHEISGMDAYATELVHRSTMHTSIALLDLIGSGDEIDVIAEKIRSINEGLNFAFFESAPSYPSLVTMPTEHTLREKLGTADKNIFSEEVENETGDTLLPMLCEAAKSFPYAKNLSDFAYLSRLSAVEAVGRELAEARIARDRRAIFSCIGGHAFASESSIDAMARWKALQYLVARHFAQTFVYASGDCSAVSFSVSNERRLAFNGEIEYRIIDKDFNPIHRCSMPCKVEESSSARIFIHDLSEYVKGHERERLLEYTLKEGASVVSRGTLLFAAEKRFSFSNPHISAEIVGDDRRFSITLTAKSYAHFVELDFADTDALFSDNCVDLSSVAPVKISFTTLGKSTSAEALTESLRIRSMYDIK